MTTEEFLQIAREKISSDPAQRLAAPAREAMSRPDCTFDVHAHIFDRRCLNIKYIALRFGRNAVRDLLGFESIATQALNSQINYLKMTDEQLYDEIAKQPEESEAEWEKFEAEIDAVSGYESTSLRGIGNAWRVLRKDSMQEIFEYYWRDFSIQNILELKNSPFVTGILMMDLETGWEMKVRRTLSQQIDDLKALANLHPTLPFFAIDPRRADLTGKEENLYGLFLKAFTEGGTSFFGVKCYPALGYLPEDVRLAPIFQICEEKNIPITTHCGGEAVSTFLKSISVKDSTGMREIELPGNNRAERARYLNDPAHWEPVVKKFPKLKINLAHFTSETFWSEYISHGTDTRIEKIIEMVSQKENQVFTDFSFNVINDDLFGALHGVMTTHPAVASKVMFGTDFWVVLPSGNLVRKQQEFLTFMEAYKEGLIRSNPRLFLMGRPFDLA